MYQGASQSLVFCVFAGSSKYLNICIELISDWLTFFYDLFIDI